MELAEWITQWTSLAAFESARLPDVDERIAAVLELCALPVPAAWTRPDPEDHRWRQGPYRRGDRGAPSSPERAVEQEIVGSADAIADGRTCMGGIVVDGIAAVALTTTPKVEADLLLLVNHQPGLRLYLAEVKAMANTPWYAIIELLRQMRLLTASSHATDYFRRKDDTVPSGLPLTGLVVAPPQYFTAPGQRRNSVGPAQHLVDAVGANTDLNACMATWDARTGTIAKLVRPAPG